MRPYKLGMPIGVKGSCGKGTALQSVAISYIRSLPLATNLGAVGVSICHSIQRLFDTSANNMELGR